RLAQVRVWVAERAASRGVPVSVRLLCETAGTRLAVSGAALTVDTSGWPELRCSTDLLGERLAELHVTVGEGPCLDAPRTGWPLYSPQVHQATGMISAQLDVGVDEAFTLLRARAFADRKPLAELAADVVARRLRFDLTDEEPS